MRPQAESAPSSPKMEPQACDTIRCFYFNYIVTRRSASSLMEVLVFLHSMISCNSDMSLHNLRRCHTVHNRHPCVIAYFTMIFYLPIQLLDFLNASLYRKYIFSVGRLKQFCNKNILRNNK